MLIMLLILYSAAMVPVRVSFELDAEGNMWVFEVTASLIFICDLVLAFNTAYQEDGVWIYDRGHIARRYLLGWCAADVLTWLWPSRWQAFLPLHSLPPRIWLPCPLRLCAFVAAPAALFEWRWQGPAGCLKASAPAAVARTCAPSLAAFGSSEGAPTQILLERGGLALQVR